MGRTSALKCARVPSPLASKALEKTVLKWKSLEVLQCGACLWEVGWRWIEDRTREAGRSDGLGHTPHGIRSGNEGMKY